METNVIKTIAVIDLSRNEVIFEIKKSHFDSIIPRVGESMRIGNWLYEVMYIVHDYDTGNICIYTE